MNKKMSKRQRDIKSKLMAAICMLLVSSIMMVSTTYAWFTLSTAPEVTGITTAVGANGNLEMALLPLDAFGENGAPKDSNYGITTNVGDSADVATKKNTTWGNLVDLSDETFYGMDKLVLYPAALNVATWDDNNAKLNPTQIAATILSTPAYGADGRVSALKADTTTSTYVAADQNFPQNKNYGVRAVGSASGMTDRQLAYRNYRSAASTAMAQAKTFASQSLNTNGNALANIALAHGVDSSAKHSQADVKALLAIVDDLLGTESTTGVLNYVENAYKNYIIAYAASAASEASMDDVKFKAFQSKIESAASLTEVQSFLTSEGVTLPDPIGSAMTALKNTRGTVEGAQADLEALLDSTKDENEKYIEWSVISEPLYDLADTDAMQINGYAASTVQTNMNAIVNDVTAGKGLTITIATGGGVYADVADHCGDYTAQITIEEVSYGGMTLNNMPARMETSTTVDDTPINAENGNYGNVYLGLLSNAVKDAGEPAGTGQVMPISDFYGYIIDLAFRTNAAESNLLLRTTPADRIYSDNKDASADTMGSGSTMTFTATTTDFTAEDMKGLMDCIRIVFFDPASNVVYATGMLDTSSATTGDGGTSVTANIYLYENKSSATNYVTIGENETVAAADRYTLSVTYTVAGDGETATHVWSDDANDYVEVSDGTATHVKNTSYVQDNNGTLKKEVTTGGPEMNKIESEATITALAQNAAKAVSVLVYLDGETITNADVAASASTSMSGSMNLQFASSANLVPMQYTPLVSQGTSTETTTAAATTLNSISTSGAAGTVTTSGSFDASGNVTINLTGVADTETVSAVTVGGTAVTSFTYASGKLTFTQEGITADSVIAITIGNA